MDSSNAGPLGQALLAPGKLALAQAADAWKQPSTRKPLLAQDVEAALKEWCEPPMPPPIVPARAERSTVQALLGGVSRPRTLAVLEPEALARALDLLDLALPAEGVQGVYAFFDDKDQLNSLEFVYRAKIEALYPEPADLAYSLRERGAQVGEAVSGTTLLRQPFTATEWLYDIRRMMRGNAVGALVRISPISTPLVSLPSPQAREFGPLSLDRTFEANRLRVALQQMGTVLRLRDKAVLAGLVKGTDLPVLGNAELQRFTRYDLVRSLTLRWPSDLNGPAAEKLLPILWGLYGESGVEGIEDATGAYLQFTWRDADTRVRLRVPFADQQPELIVEDARGNPALAGRVQIAEQRELDERKERLAEGKPRLRLARSFEDLNDLPFGAVELGRPRAKVEAALPHTSWVRRKSIPGGLSLLLVNPPTPGYRYWARQLYVRFDAADRVAEIRVRYDELRGGDKRSPALLDQLSEGAAGKPESIPAEWTGLWTDLPRPGTAVKYCWEDDSTLITYEADAGAIEVVRRDRPADQAAGVALPPLTLFPPGVGKCELGMSVADLRTTFKTRTDPQTGADVFRFPASSPYDLAMVWSEGGVVSRIIAVDKRRPELPSRTVEQVLQEVWGRDLDQWGYVRRITGKTGQVLGSYFWQDDRTRVRLFVQDTEEGPRLFTEWRPWPLAENKTAVAER